jgi:hypothetical protein
MYYLTYSRFAWNLSDLVVGFERIGIPFLPSPFPKSPAGPWRAVALDTPILWTLLGDVQLKQKSGYTKFLETMLRRSKTMDLWIYIYAPFQELKTYRNITPLVRHAHRWRVVTFDTTQSAVAAFRGVHHRLPRLQSLSLYLEGQGGEKITPILFSDAPSLTEVTISGLSPPIQLPWGQLKSFNEQNHAKEDSTKLAHIFNHSTDSLEHLEVMLRPTALLSSMLSVSREASRLPFTFHKLKTVRLTCMGYVDDHLGYYFISILTLPCLEELYLSNCPTPLLRFFQRSFGNSRDPPLKQLSLRNSPPSSHMVEILRLVPHLEHLEVNLTTANGILGEISEQKVPLLPELKTLVIQCIPSEALNSVDMDVDEFTALARSRCKSTMPAEDTAVRTLTDINIIFPCREYAFSMQRYLNGWCGQSAGDRIRHYDAWRVTLNFHLASSRPNFAAGVNEVLVDIENSEPHEVNYIYV